MKKRLLFILIVFIAWLPVFVIQKPVFMFYQHALSEACTFTDFLQVMLHGLKLDCTIAGYLTAIPLLLTLVSVWLPGAWLKKVLKGYFLIMGILVSAIFSVDVALYSFWGFRLDATLFFYLQSPADAMASVPLGLFFIQLLVFVAYALGIYAWFTFILRFAPVKPSFPPTGLEQLGSTFAILLAGGILFIPIRGGVTTSTANVGMVYFSQNQFLNHSAINPCFSLIASLSKQQDFASQFDFYPEEKRKALFDTLIQAQDSLCPGDSIPTEPVKLLTTTRPNILIIIMESFTANAIEAVGGEPACIPSHDFHDGDSEGIIDSHIPLQLRKGGGNIFGCRGKTRAVVNLHQVVVNGLWRSDDFYILKLLGTAVPGQLIHCVHGVIPAYVYEIGDIVFPKNINQNPVLGSVLFRPG